jgi:UDP-N-acetyl-D-mannosaminuronate dehydrogenase
MAQRKNVDLEELRSILRAIFEALRKTKQVMQESRAINDKVAAFTAAVRELQAEFDRAFAHVIERIDRIEEHLGIEEDSDA